MSNMLRIATAAVAALAIVTAVGATAAATNEAVSTLSGQVVSVDAKAGTILVKVDAGQGQSKDLSFSVTADTKIMLKGTEPMPLASVHAGDKVTVNSKAANGKNVALSIGVEPKAA